MRSISDTVRGPDKIEKAEDFLIGRLPYHADLLESLSFGAVPAPPGSLALLGTQPPPDAVAHARLTTALNSARRCSPPTTS